MKGAKIYRGRILMAEHVRYLDFSALKRAKKAVIEIGSVRAANVAFPLVAEVRNGMIVKLLPEHCTSCKPSTRKSSVWSGRQRAAKEALQKVRDLGLHSVQLPMPISQLQRGAGAGLFGLPTITIIWDPLDFCIAIEFTDGEICLICIGQSFPGFCLGPTGP